MQTQQTTRAPFFKPLSPPSLAFTGQPPENVQERPLDKQRMAGQATRGKDLSWDTIQSASLHARLQQEAEKIRRFKLSTELDLKQRERKIVECQTTIEQQRKSIFELQLETEDLTVRLQNEVSNQQEIQHKIEATRDMCRALKDHSAKLNENVQKGEADREVLSTQHHNQLERVQELVAKFKHLELQCAAEKEEMTRQLHEEQATCAVVKEKCEAQVSSLLEERTSLQTEASSLSEKVLLLTEQLDGVVKERHALEVEQAVIQDKLRHTENVSKSQTVQIASLEERLQVCQGTIADLSNSVHSTQEAMSTLEADKNHQLDRCSTEAKKISEELVNAKATLDSVQTELAKEEQRSLLLLRDLEAEQTKHDTLLTVKGSLEERNTVLSQNLVEVTEKEKCLQDQFQMLTSEMSCLKEELQNTKHLHLESNELAANTKDQLVAAQQDINNLTQEKEAWLEARLAFENDIEVGKEAFTSMQRDAEDARNHQKALNDQLSLVQEDLKSSRSECETLCIDNEALKPGQIMGVDTIAEEQCSTHLVGIGNFLVWTQGHSKDPQLLKYRPREAVLSIPLHHLCSTIPKFREEVESLFECTQTSLKDIDKREFDTAKEEIAALTLALDKAKAQLQGYIEEEHKLKQDLADLQEETNALRDGLKQTQLDATSATGKAGEALDKKQQQVKTLKKDLAEEVKKCRASEKQIRNLNTQMIELEKQMSARDSKVEELTETLCRRDDEVNTCNDKITRLEGLQESAEAAIASEREAQEQYDLKSQELCATLEKYKMENQKIVESKDKEVEELRSKVHAMEKEYLEVTATKGKLENDLQGLQQQLEEQKLIQVANVAALTEDLGRLKDQNELMKLKAKSSQPSASTTSDPEEDQAMDTSTSSCDVNFQKLPRTPRRSSVTANTSTGCSTPVMPENVGSAKALTPGILRTGPSSLPNKRKVVFAGDATITKSPEASEDSIAQDADLALRTAPRTPSTPCGKLSHSQRSPSTTSTPRRNIRNAPTTPLSARHSPAAKQARLAVARPAAQKEMDQFSELFPLNEIENEDVFGGKDKLTPSARDKKRISSLQSKRSLKKVKIKVSDGSAKKVKADQTNWFDTDTVFGFRPEE